MPYYEFITIAFGAVLGSGLAYFHTYFQRRTEKEEDRRAKMTALLAEMIDIQSALNSGAGMGQAKVSLSDAMWRASLGDIFGLSEEIREPIRKFYFKVAEFNSVVTYDLYHSGVGQGTFDRIMEVRIKEAAQLAVPAIQGLQTYLSVNPAAAP